MAEIFTLPGVELPSPEESKPSDIAVYCRRLADLIDSGEARVDGAVILLTVGPSVTHMQVIGLQPRDAMGAIAYAFRAAR